MECIATVLVGVGNYTMIYPCHQQSPLTSHGQETTMLVSPAEHHPLVKALGPYSQLPEKYGADILFAIRGQWVGVQRKEYSDLINSFFDGRLHREMGMMQRLAMRMLVVEGRPQWSLDGYLVGNGFGGERKWTLAHHHGILWDARAKGVWVEWSDSVAGTVRVVELFQRWCAKEQHHALEHRPNAKSAWGKVGNEEFARHLVMGLPGVGPELAGKIVDKFGGVPWTWTVTKEQLMEVQGVGEKKATAMLSSLM